MRWFASKHFPLGERNNELGVCTRTLKRKALGWLKLETENLPAFFLRIFYWRVIGLSMNCTFPHQKLGIGIRNNKESGSVVKRYCERTERIIPEMIESIKKVSLSRIEPETFGLSNRTFVKSATMFRCLSGHYLFIYWFFYDLGFN